VLIDLMKNSKNNIKNDRERKKNFIILM